MHKSTTLVLYNTGRVCGDSCKLALRIFDSLSHMTHPSETSRLFFHFCNFTLSGISCFDFRLLNRYPRSTVGHHCKSLGFLPSYKLQRVGTRISLAPFAPKFSFSLAPIFFPRTAHPVCSTRTPWPPSGCNLGYGMYTNRDRL